MTDTAHLIDTMKLLCKEVCHSLPKPTCVRLFIFSHHCQCCVFLVYFFQSYLWEVYYFTVLVSFKLWVILYIISSLYNWFIFLFFCWTPPLKHLSFPLFWIFGSFIVNLSELSLYNMTIYLFHHIFCNNLFLSTPYFHFILFFTPQKIHKFYVVIIISYFRNPVFCYLYHVKKVSISKVIGSAKVEIEFIKID